jgi:glycerol-3-phosphate acyltransferase PlsY
LKGAIPAFVFGYIFQFPIQYIILPMIFIIIGHNYSVWLKLKGGRGLATSAGMVVIINFWLLLIWCVVYVITNFFKKDIHTGNIAATILMPIVIIFPASFYVKFTYGTGNDSFEMLFTFSCLISLLILIRHIKPVMEMIRAKKSLSSSSSSSSSSSL